MSHNRNKKLNKIKELSGVTLQDASEQQPKTKRRKKSTDGAYNPRQEYTYISHQKRPALTHRFDQSSHVKKSDDSLTPKKTTVLLRQSPIKSLITSENFKQFNQSLAANPQHTPVKDITYSATGTPILVKSQSGHALYPAGNNNIFHFFSNDSKDQGTAKPSIPTTLKAESNLSTPDNKLEVNVHLTAELLSLVGKEIKKNAGRRQKISKFCCRK